MRLILSSLAALLCAFAAARVGATPVNKADLSRYYGTFLHTNLNSCVTCHMPGNKLMAETLEEFPHNAFGDRLRLVGKKLRFANEPHDMASRLKLVASEDADGDGVSNEREILLGSNPGEAKETAERSKVAKVSKVEAKFAAYRGQYQWAPFQPVVQPALPKGTALNPIDRFLNAELAKVGVKPQPQASRENLLRRIYIDLIGLNPTPAELQALLSDKKPDAYERVVDRLLADPRHGERWARHWMDIWRYSDWAGWSGGSQVRDSKPHIWRWRDWIIESLNANKGYDAMLGEMLAADEFKPGDTNALRATGFLVRNFKMLSREQWLEDTVKHTSQGLLGLTVGCAKCHDHFFDPISQKEYYELRAIFEPHNVRTDRIPGQVDVVKAGLVRAFDASPEVKTFLFPRGDERNPDTNRTLNPGVPRMLGGGLKIEPVKLPREEVVPDKRAFVKADLVVDARAEIGRMEAALAEPRTNSFATRIAEHNLVQAKLKSEVLVAMLRAEELEDAGQKQTEEWVQLALRLNTLQKGLEHSEAIKKMIPLEEALGKTELALKEAKPAEVEAKTKEVATANEKLKEVVKTVDAAKAAVEQPALASFKPREVLNYPTQSTGRRKAFANWLVESRNPLTARVAVNHIWLRHFGQALAPSVADFGANGRAPQHPALLDWLAAEFMESGWEMKKLHKLMVMSEAYRRAATPDARALKLDPDNLYFWRGNSRRLEAEAVRDNLLYLAGELDPTMGGPEVDHEKGMESKRRSVYLRIAAEKEVAFLRIFDGPNVTECYERKQSVMPQQALALSNSELALAMAKKVSGRLWGEAQKVPNVQTKFIDDAFVELMSRWPSSAEQKACVDFLAKVGPGEDAARKRENLILVLFNHNDFITVR